MPSFQIQGQAVEVSQTDYYLYWYRFFDPLANLAIGYYAYLPNRDDFGLTAIDRMLSFLRANYDRLDDAELRERAASLLALIEALPPAHQEMLRAVTQQLAIKAPQTAQGRREFTLKWKKLLAGQAQTAELQQALNTLSAYTAWVNDQIQAILSHKAAFEQRIINLDPEVAERLRHP